MDKLEHIYNRIALSGAKLVVTLVLVFLLSGYLVNALLAVSMIGDWSYGSGLHRAETLELVLRLFAFFVAIPFSEQRTTLVMLVGLLTWIHLLLVYLQLIPYS